MILNQQPITGIVSDDIGILPGVDIFFTDASGKMLSSVNTRDGEELNIGYISNIDGAYSINIPNNYENKYLTFSFMGMKSKTINVSELKEKPNVSLYEDVKIIENVNVCWNRTFNMKCEDVKSTGAMIFGSLIVVGVLSRALYKKYRKADVLKVEI